MTTIAEENRKHLRKAMTVDCGFRETAEEPTSITPVGSDPGYTGLANFGHEHLTTILMDLAGDGFLNDGRAVPMQTDTDSYRYGYISEEAAKADGTFTTPLGITLEADNQYNKITVEIMDQSGNVQTKMLDPIWFAGQTTVYIDSFTPGQRAYIVGVYLGKAWIWTNENLLSVNADLRSVSTVIGGELEVSSLSIEAYEPNDPTEFIGNIPLGAPIWYIAGYDGDLAPMRKFYLSEVASWEDNVLNVQGQDASSLLDSKEVTWQWYTIPSNNSVTWVVQDMLELALDSVAYDTIGSEPQLTYGNSQDIYFEAIQARSLISQLTNFYRDADYLRVTYVDAGRPCLTWGGNGKTFTIYADEISDFKSSAEQNINEITVNLSTYAEGAKTEFERIDAVANRTYYIEFDVPVTRVYWNPEPKSREIIGYRKAKFVAAETTEYVISVNYLETIIDDGDNPYIARSFTQGISYAIDETMQSLLIDSGSLPKLSLPELLSRSNQTYEFTYRGNPHIQPRDVLNVEVATWSDVYETVDGLFPATDLYPANDLYPYAVYKKVRKMIKRWEIMTVDSVTLEHKEGGLTSTIRARKGVV